MLATDRAQPLAVYVRVDLVLCDLTLSVE